MFKKIIVIIVSLFPVFVYAITCSTDVYNEMKERANKIEVLYENVEPYQDYSYSEIGSITIYDKYKVTIKNMPEAFYFTINNSSYKNYSKRLDETGNYVFNAYPGIYTYNFYSDECEESLKEVNFYYTKYNYFSNDIFCIGMRKFLKICDTWVKENDFEYFDNLSNDDFNEYINGYNDGSIFEKLKYFIREYIYYAIIIGSILILITIILLIKLVKILYMVKVEK